VNWLVDTQLPHQLATALKQRGHHAVHASELRAGHLSSDDAIIEQADREGAVVVTKDSDFLAAYEVNGRPRRLLYVATGNIRNTELIFLFMRYLDVLCQELKDGGLVEMDRNGITVR
jgi:predicted nuclease of predicted toxin-antitoxin system